MWYNKDYSRHLFQIHWKICQSEFERDVYVDKNYYNSLEVCV